jgi:Flp pilus assembly protein TadD
VRRWGSRTSGSGEAEFRKVLDLAPSDDYAHYALGRALKNQGRHDEAATHLKLARSLRPRPPGQPGIEDQNSLRGDASSA